MKSGSTTSPDTGNLSSKNERVIEDDKKRREMATEFCQKCKQSHPVRLCDYDENGECVETAAGETVERNDSVQRVLNEDDLARVGRRLREGERR